VALAFTLILGLFLEAGVIGPVIQPFDLNDFNIQYFQQNDIVPGPIMVAFSLLAPVIVCVILQFFVKNKDERSYLRPIIGHIQAWALTILITDSLKLFTGELRPYFLDACKPDLNLICTGDPKVIKEARLSFPSGHSSLSFESMVFLSLYLYHYFRFSFSRPLDLPLSHPSERSSKIRARYFFFIIIISPLMASTFIALSRVADKHHHYNDILWGSMIGTASAITVFFLNYPKFKFSFDNPKLN